MLAMHISNASSNSWLRYGLSRKCCTPSHSRVVINSRSRDDLQFRADFPQGLQRAQAVQPWHHDIQQHNFDFLAVFLDGFKGLVAVGRF